MCGVPESQVMQRGSVSSAGVQEAASPLMSHGGLAMGLKLM